MNQFSRIDLGLGGSDENSSQRLCVSDTGEFYPCDDVSVPVASASSQSTKQSDYFSPSTNFQQLGEYTEQMVYVIFDKLSVQSLEKTIAVPPFITWVPEMVVNGPLNVELAELFIADMQNIGLPVAENVLTYADTSVNTDFLNTIPYIQVNDDIGYVLKGTIRKNQQGITVYAKVIDVESKAVIAATSKLIPHYMIAQQANY
ncbi:FlgO family outer membrane protein [Thalassotalea ganghwensis]